MISDRIIRGMHTAKFIKFIHKKIIGLSNLKKYIKYSIYSTYISEDQ